MSLIYRNRALIQQRGGSLLIDNTTEQEKIKLSQRSGSNINLTNVVTSELATNNKQTNVVNDLFETIGGDKTSFVANTNTIRTGENTYNFKGFIDKNQLDSFKSWKDTYNQIAKLNSQFKILRGGNGYPNGDSTTESGSRIDNPVLKNQPIAVENVFHGYDGSPIRTSSVDDVVSYSTVIDRGNTLPANIRDITIEDIEKSAGANGSSAPGVIEFGPSKSAATEEGSWITNPEASQIDNIIVQLQEQLTPIEKQMGDGGDEIIFIKRNKYEQIGAEFNDYPSIRIDEKGRSQPFEMLVSDTATYKNHDYVPHIEEVDNSSIFPCGNDDKVVSNRYSRSVGSGGIHFKTTGATALGGTTLKGGYKKINLNASHGIQIASEAFVEIQSLKSITLRTNRQVYIEGCLGVKNNVIIGGGLSVEGETYVQHITAPLEVHQTEDTTVFGQFATDTSRSLPIGEVYVSGEWQTVYALPDKDIIVTYPHSHHHHGIPMRLTQSNEDVRKFAQKENINKHSYVSQALPQIHERKIAQVAPD